MAYRFKYTEKNNKTAAEFETKALLYLIGVDKDSKKISLVFVDCFNDVTGCNVTHSSLWDVQSKGVAGMSPGEIGRSLATLFINHCADLPFYRFALFMPAPKEEYVYDGGLKSFTVANFKEPTAGRIKKGLIKEVLKREKISAFSDELVGKISFFLEKVNFVIDSMEPKEYVKAVTKFKNKEIKEDALYQSVFEEIKKVQVGKKLNSIHEEEINAVAEALKFDRHLSSDEISQLLINRLVGVDLFRSKSLPIEFRPEVEGMDSLEAKEVIQDCKSDVARAFFDKNKKSIFWKFLEKVIQVLQSDNELAPRDIYKRVEDIKGLSGSCLSGLAGIYFIALVKDGLAL